MPVEQSLKASGISSYRPSPAALKTAVRETLLPIKERAAATERSRQVPSENVEALRAAGLYKVVQPREFGGYEYDFDVLVDLVIEVARACASTAWVCGLFAAHQWLLAGLPLKAQRDVWAGDADALLCGSYAPTCNAVADTGGYRLTGRWAFASGCDNSQWSFCAALLPNPSEGRVQPAFLVVPASDYSIDDTWDVVGLAGTGSKTLVLDDVFVPAHRVVRFSETTSGETPGASIYPNRNFNIPMLCLIPSCLAAVAVGAARERWRITSRKRAAGSPAARSPAPIAGWPSFRPSSSGSPRRPRRSTQLGSSCCATCRTSLIKAGTRGSSVSRIELRRGVARHFRCRLRSGLPKL